MSPWASLKPYSAEEDEDEEEEEEKDEDDDDDPSDEEDAVQSVRMAVEPQPMIRKSLTCFEALAAICVIVREVEEATAKTEASLPNKHESVESLRGASTLREGIIGNEELADASMCILRTFDPNRTK